MFFRLNALLHLLQLEHVFGNGLLNFGNDERAQVSAHKVFGIDHGDFAHGDGDGEGPNQFFLFFAQLQHGQLRYEGHAFSALHHAHECLDAAQRIGLLALFRLFELAKFHSLVAKTVALIKHPQVLAFEVGCADDTMLCQRVALGHITKKLLKKQVCQFKFVAHAV